MIPVLTLSIIFHQYVCIYVSSHKDKKVALHYRYREKYNIMSIRQLPFDIVGGIEVQGLPQKGLSFYFAPPPQKKGEGGSVDTIYLYLGSMLYKYIMECKNILGILHYTSCCCSYTKWGGGG